MFIYHQTASSNSSFCCNNISKSDRWSRWSGTTDLFEFLLNHSPLGIYLCKKIFKKKTLKLHWCPVVKHADKAYKLVVHLVFILLSYAPSTSSLLKQTAMPCIIQEGNNLPLWFLLVLWEKTSFPQWVTLFRKCKCLKPKKKNHAWTNVLSYVVTLLLHISLKMFSVI